MQDLAGIRVLAAIAILGFVLCLAAGWVVLLVIGIIRLRKRAPAGVALTVIGGVWGALSLSVVAIGVGVSVYAHRQAARFGGMEDFDPVQYQGRKGSIVVPHKGESSLRLQEEGGKLIRLHTKDGVLVAPAGTYRLVSFEAVGKDENNQEWEARCYFPPRTPGKVSVTDGSSQDVKVGPPFRASVSVTPKGQDQATFDLKLTGSDGNQYTIARKGGRSEPPSFQVISKSGEILWQGRLEYG